MSGTMVKPLLSLFTVGNVNRIGMVLEFFSFWFAAPELLGEERLRRLRDSFGRGIKALPSLTAKILYWILVLSLPVILIVVFWRRVSAYVNWSLRHPLLEEVTDLLLTVLAIAVEVYTFKFLSRYVAEPILTKLADNNRLRQHSLVLAAVLFVVGFIFQFTATFL